MWCARRGGSRALTDITVNIPRENYNEDEEGALVICSACLCDPYGPREKLEKFFGFVPQLRDDRACGCDCFKPQLRHAVGLS